LQSTKANIFYEKKRVTFEADSHRVTKEMFGVTGKCIEGYAKSVSFSKRSETIVELPVKKGEQGAEGLTDKLEIAEGIYVASSFN
jgi:hypothetical protein